MNKRGRRARSGSRAIDLRTCSLARFATAVHTAIKSVGDGCRERFGQRKVFISAVYVRLVVAGARPGDLDSFKARLMLAATGGLVELARADLVAAMPFDAVAASEISVAGTTYHFVVDPAARERWEVEISAEVA
jgi:hypothetical protein